MIIFIIEWCLKYFFFQNELSIFGSFFWSCYVKTLFPHMCTFIAIQFFNPNLWVDPAVSYSGTIVLFVRYVHVVKYHSRIRCSNARSIRQTPLLLQEAFHFATIFLQKRYAPFIFFFPELSNILRFVAIWI